ncbi:MAG: hypothetical protein BMS9Abin20_1318 [Acidimicrobiia bacterium]|nr:MAG: hypothetical protein BMS9Abin20_1318 [Acidimicrobiia bacterium]
MSTLITLGVVAALAVALAIPGIPAAILMGRRRTLHIAPTIALGLFLGLGIVLVIVVGLVHLDAYTTPIFVVVLAAVSAGLWLGALVTRPTIRRPKFTPAGAVLGIVVTAGMFLRTDPIYFIYQTADFGEYVNRANSVAAGGSFGEWFLNLFPAALSVPSLIFGSIHTVDAMPLLGLLLVIGIAAISHRLGFPPWATVVAAFIASFHIVPVWFSEFPASEMLSAVLLTGMLVVLAAAITERSTAAAVAAGSFGFLLAIARANAMLLAPIVVLASITAIMLIDKEALKTTTRFIWAFFAASIVGFFYDITFNFPYFVEFQLGLFFPDSMIRAVARLRDPLVAIAVGIILGAAVWGLIVAARWISDRQNLARWLSTYLPLGLLAGVFVFIAVRALSGNYTSPGGKILILGPVLLVLAIAGVVMGAFARHRMPPERWVVYWIATVAAVAFAGLQAVRLGLPVNEAAPYFLYWQRYYVSEVFPIAVVLALWPLELLIAGAGRFVHAQRWRRLAPVAAAVFVMALVGVEALGPNVTVASGTMFKDSYETIAELDRLTSDPPNAPIIYIGSNNLPEGWFWVNTSRLIALPLAETFGRRLVANDEPREPDLQPTDIGLVDILTMLDTDTVYLITDLEAVPDGTVLAANGWEMSEAGAVNVTIERLPWERDKTASEQRYVSTTLELQVYKLTRTSSGG